MNSSLDSLVNNLSEINNKTCVKCKERENSTQYCEFTRSYNNRLHYECLKCKEISCKPIKPLFEKFPNTYRLSNNDNNAKFIPLLRKGVYRYENLDNRNRFKEK